LTGFAFLRYDNAHQLPVVAFFGVMINCRAEVFEVTLRTTCCPFIGVPAAHPRCSIRTTSGPVDTIESSFTKEVEQPFSTLCTLPWPSFEWGDIFEVDIDNIGNGNFA
jgi:hypothetical protein